MDLLSVFKRGSAGQASSDPAPTLDSVASARRRARQRLIGATVLVVIAVIGFPLVFDSAPRPVSLDVPIDIPRKDGAPQLTMPAARPADGSTAGAGASGAQSATSVATASTSTASAATATASGSATGQQASDSADSKAPRPDARASIGPPGPPHAARAPAVVPAPATTAATTAATRPSDKPSATARTEQARPADDASRARALLEGKPVAKIDPAPAPKSAGPTLPAAAPRPAPAAAATTTIPAADTRFAIQVAAFSTEPSAQDMRNKLEKAGVKSYTQVVDTPQGKRIRVRVGPFSSRDEAERAADKIRSAGLPSSIVPL